jgi:hypothetical protein
MRNPVQVDEVVHAPKINLEEEEIQMIDAAIDAD